MIYGLFCYAYDTIGLLRSPQYQVRHPRGLLAPSPRLVGFVSSTLRLIRSQDNLIRVPHGPLSRVLLTRSDISPRDCTLCYLTTSRTTSRPPSYINPMTWTFTSETFLDRHPRHLRMTSRHPRTTTSLPRLLRTPRRSLG